MEFDKRDEGAFWTHNTDECEETIEGTVDWFPIADEFPEMLWCLYYPERDTYTCHALPNDPGAYGLVTFSTLVIGEKFIRGMSNRKPGLTGCVPVVRTFDEARMLAKQRDTVQAVILLDDPENPSIHYVKAAGEESVG